MHTKWLCLKITRYHNSSIKAPGMNQHFFCWNSLSPLQSPCFQSPRVFRSSSIFDDRNKIIPPGAARKILLMEILHQLIWLISNYLQGFIHPRWCRISSNSITGRLFVGVVLFLSDMRYRRWKNIALLKEWRQNLQWSMHVVHLPGFILQYQN